MNPEIKAKWTTALRSGQINGRPVEQTKDFLRNDDENGNMRACCLGVLTELAADEGIVKRNGLGSTMGETVYMYENEYGNWERHEDEDLPPAVYEWAGLSSSNPRVLHDDSEIALSVINDDYGLSFNKIAALIDESL